MKTLKQFIGESEQINEYYVPPIQSFPPQWQPYVTAIYCLVLLWLGIIGITGGEDPTFGYITIKQFIQGKVEDFRYKKQLEEIKEILEKDEEYQSWEADKNHRLKDLKSIIMRLRNDNNIKKVISDIWKESKK
jgi:hypothetical protein